MSPRPSLTPDPPGWWQAATAGVCSHGGHGYDGETCSDAPASRCATIGHGTRPATHVVSYRYRGGTEVTTEFVCASCAESYGRRPVLADFTARAL